MHHLEVNGAPGPLGVRSNHLAMLGSIPGAMAAMLAFGEGRASCVVDRASPRFAARCITTPAAAGRTMAIDPKAAPARKLRPTAQLEVMLKLVAAAVMDEEPNELRALLEPHPLGAATPVAVEVPRGWHETQEEPNEPSEGAIGSEERGTFCRSLSLKTAAKAEQSYNRHGGTAVEGSRGACEAASSGGFQKLTLAQVMFERRPAAIGARRSRR